MGDQPIKNEFWTQLILSTISKIFCLKLRPKFLKSGENLCYIQGALPLSFANDEEPIHWDESKSITVNQNLSWTLRHVLMPPKTTLVLLSTAHARPRLPLVITKRCITLGQMTLGGQQEHLRQAFLRFATLLGLPPTKAH